MTSEAPHRPGQEPGEVSPGAGGPAPYGDRPAQQDNGYPGTPDLGWAPPPPTGRPTQPAPAWAAQDEQPPTPAWGSPQGQPPAATWGAAQAPQQAEPGAWGAPGGSPQPAWAAQEQTGPAWAAASAPGPTAQSEQSAPAWATPEQAGPAWPAAAPGAGEQSQPAWAQAGEPGARGAAQVPAPGGQPHDTWPAPGGQPQDDPGRSGGWTAASTPQQDDDSARSSGWNPGGVPQDDRSGGWPVGAGAQGQDDPARSGGWPVGAGAQGQDDAARSGGWAGAQQHDDTARSGGWPGAQQHDDTARSGGWAGAQQHDDPARSGGWATPAAQQDDRPAWAPQGEQSAPAWAPAEPGARGAAQIPAPSGQPNDAWSTPDDPARSGGWAVGAGAQQQDDPARSGGWAVGTAAQPDDPARSGGWPAGVAAQDDDPDRSGGWAAGRAAAHSEQSQPSPWGAQDQQPANGWSGSAAAPGQQDDRPGQDWATPEQPARAAAAVPAPSEGPESWTPSGPTPARASASVPSPDGPPAWAGNQDNASQWTAGERAIPDAEPWAPGAAWGRAAEAEPAPQQSNAWEPGRAEEPAAYQPAPAPGISPANAVPLPPQEQRVPGASLAAAPPADYAPSFAPGGESTGREAQAHESEQPGGAPGWGLAGSSHQEPQSPAGPVVPAPRTSPEAGSVSASASVPVASRVTPPADQGVLPAGAPAPQPRVYGRPTRPEPEDGPEQDAPNGFPQPGPHGDEQGGQRRFDDQDRSPNAFAEAPPVPSAPPSSPAGPPPFPPGVPSFTDPAGNSRPVNGVHPHSGERAADPFGSPAGPGNAFPGPNGQGGPGDPFGGPGGPGDPFGGPGAHQGGPGEPYGGPAGGRASVNAMPGHGSAGMTEQAPGGFPPAFPPPPQQAPPAWQQGGGTDPDQGRFDAFKPEAAPKTESPTPKVRNGRVLAAVLITAVLILAVPLGLLKLLGKVGADDKPAPFAVGSCVKQSGGGAVEVDCGEQGAFTVVSRVDAKEKCADPTQPHVVLPGDGANRVLCLKPAGQ